MKNDPIKRKEYDRKYRENHRNEIRARQRLAARKKRLANPGIYADKVEADLRYVSCSDDFDPSADAWFPDWYN